MKRSEKNFMYFVSGYLSLICFYIIFMSNFRHVFMFAIHFRLNVCESSQFTHHVVFIHFHRITGDWSACRMYSACEQHQLHKYRCVERLHTVKWMVFGDDDRWRWCDDNKNGCKWNDSLWYVYVCHYTGWYGVSSIYIKCIWFSAIFFSFALPRNTEKRLVQRNKNNNILINCTNNHSSVGI